MAPPFSLESHIEPSQRRVRVLFGGKYIVDTQNAQLVWVYYHSAVTEIVANCYGDGGRWEHKYFPVYYFLSQDLSPSYLRSSSKNDDLKTETFDITVGDHTAANAVTKFSVGNVAGLVKIDRKAIDNWFEEDEEMWNHPKDPYHVNLCISSPVSDKHLNWRFQIFSVLMFCNPRATSGLSWME